MNNSSSSSSSSSHSSGRSTVPTEFGPDARFALNVNAATPFRASQENEFERLKNRLLAKSIAQAWVPGLNSQLRRAANEAAALAWITSYPLLVFPGLFEEKAAAALKWADHQVQVRVRSRELLVA